MQRRDFLLAAAAAPLVSPGPATAQRSRGIIDVHAHCAMQAVDAFLKAQSIPSGSINSPLPRTDSPDHMAARLQMMDQAGVRTQVLSPAPIPYIQDEATAVRYARLVNDGHARLMREHPGRIAAYVYLPLPHIAASLAEMKRGLDELGMSGVSMFNAVGDRSTAGAEFDPLYAEMDRRRTVLFIHPCANGMGSPLLQNYGMSASVGPMMEDTTMVVHLITHQVPTRFPGVKIIVPHLGGPLAMMLARLDNQIMMQNPKLTELPSRTAQRLWYDTVCHGSGPALRCACETIGASRFVAGSDYPALLPFEPYPKTFDYIRHVDLPKGAAEQILYANAEVLFPDLVAAMPAGPS